MTRIILAGDIGGTKTILSLVQEIEKDLSPVAQTIYPSQNYPDLVPMVKHFLAKTSQPPPKAACFAVAGPVVDQTSNLTNLNWSLDVNRLQSALSIKKISLINDFAAIAYGISSLSQHDLVPIQSAVSKPSNPIAIIGAGTGLGQCFAINHSTGLQVFPTEGGHCDFAPRSEIEFQLLQYLKQKHQWTRVSIERILSGFGIISIYQFLRDTQSDPETESIAQIVKNWEAKRAMVKPSDQETDPAAIITQAALEKSDALCQKTLEMFIQIYGAEAGNLALKIMPFGGLFISGGIAAKILPLMLDGLFIKHFTEKGRLKPILEAIPVSIIVNPQVGLIGARNIAVGLL